MPIALEICIDAAFAHQASQAAYEGGASRIELCSQMNLDGLTPSIQEIELARKAFPKPGLMVMIRPRAGDFVYSSSEIKQMLQSIKDSKDAGANGVVLGVLKNHQINTAVTRELVELAQSLELSVTFHRAFDAIKDRPRALEELIDLGVERVLTSGTAWKSKLGVLKGLDIINSLLRQADNQIEIILAGDINAGNISAILQGLEPRYKFSIHAHSGAQEKGTTTVAAVKILSDFIVSRGLRVKSRELNL
jgi:copper homeostasis protein